MNSTLGDIPVQDTAVWTAAELLQQPDWIFTWSEQEIAEMDAVIAALHNGTPVLAPLMSARLDALARGLEEGRGLFLVRGVPIRRWPEGDAKALTLWMGRQMGVPKGQNAAGALISVVRNVGADYTRDPEARGYMSNAELMPHTDGCDITGLLCLRRAKSGGESRICSALAVFNHIRATEPELLAPLIEGLPYYLRDADGMSGRLLAEPVPVYFAVGNTVSTFYNPKSIEVGADKRGQPLTELERRALDRVNALANDPEFCAEFTLEEGDLLLFSNWTTFHSRKDFVDHDEEGERRCLLRLWIHSKYERPLPGWIAASARGGLGAGGQ